MKRFLYSALLMLLSLVGCLDAMASDEVQFFARYESERKQLIEGDSCRINLVLYSSLPFRDVICSPQHPKVKGGTLRPVAMGSRAQRLVRLTEGVFYELVWQQYVVASSKQGAVSLAPITIEGTFAIMEVDPSPFSQFFGSGQREVGQTKVKTRSEKFLLPVVPRPKRTQQEIIQSGGRVA